MLNHQGLLIIAWGLIFQFSAIVIYVIPYKSIIHFKTIGGIKLTSLMISLEFDETKNLFIA